MADNKDGVSIAESLARGGAQGATFGQSDEIQALAKNFVRGGVVLPKEGVRLREDQLQKLFPGLSTKDAKEKWEQNPMMTPGRLKKLYPNDDYLTANRKWNEEMRPDIASANAAEEARKQTQDNYRGVRSEVRAREQLAKDTNPIAYHGADLVASVLVPIPGMAGAARLETGAKLLAEKGTGEGLKILAPALAREAASQGATRGGLRGFGSSESDDPMEQFWDTTKGAGLGAATGYGMSRVGSKLAGDKLAAASAGKAADKSIDTTAKDWLSKELLKRLTTATVGGVMGNAVPGVGPVAGALVGAAAPPVLRQVASQGARMASPEIAGKVGGALEPAMSAITPTIKEGAEGLYDYLMQKRGGAPPEQNMSPVDLQKAESFMPQDMGPAAPEAPKKSAEDWIPKE